MTRRKDVDHQIRLFPVGEYQFDDEELDETDPLSRIGHDEDLWKFLMGQTAQMCVKTGFRFRGSGESSGDDVV